MRQGRWISKNPDFDAFVDQLDVGSLVRFARERARCSQFDFATRLGTSQSTLSRWESNRLVPSLRMLVRICAEAGVDLIMTLRRDPEAVTARFDGTGYGFRREQLRRADTLERSVTRIRERFPPMRRARR